MATIRPRKSKKGISYDILYSYKEEDGTYTQKSAGTVHNEIAAKKLKATTELNILTNSMIEPSTKTVKDFFVEDFFPLRAKNKEWEYSTLSTAEGLFEKHIYPILGSQCIQKVAPVDIVKLFANLGEKKLDSPRYRNMEPDKIPYLSGATLGYIYTLLNCGFKSAVEWKLITENPVTLDKPERNTPEAKFWDVERIKIALELIEDPQLHLAVHLATTSSARLGEICGLCTDMIDFKEGKVNVEKTMQRISKKAFTALPKKEVFIVFPEKVEGSSSMLVLKTPKTPNSEREFYLTKAVLKELTYRLQAIAKNKLFHGDNYHDYGLIFCQEDGSPVEPNLLEKWFRKWQRRNDTGLTYLKFHELRHSATTLMYRLAKGNIRTVQAFTGNSEEMVMHYTHQELALQKKLVKDLESVVYGNNESPDAITATSISSDKIDDLLAEIQKDPLMQQRVLDALLA